MVAWVMRTTTNLWHHVAVRRHWRVRDTSHSSSAWFHSLAHTHARQPPFCGVKWRSADIPLVIRTLWYKLRNHLLKMAETVS